MSKIPDEIPPERAADYLLAEGFQRAGEQRAAEMRAGGRRWRRPPAVRRGVVAAFVVLLIGGGAATATKVFVFDDAPTSSDPRPPRVLRHAPADRSLGDTRAADPVERIPWGLRVYKSVGGQTCLLAGRVVQGRLGRVTDGRFHELPADAPGFCNGSDHHLMLTERSYGAADGDRTAIYGLADRFVLDLSLAVGGKVLDLPIADDGTFLLVFRGARALRGGRLHVRTARGEQTRRVG
jgi:hypothetical protein